MIEDVLNGTKDWEVMEGSALETLKSLPERSVQCCVTSPPYFGLRAYGTAPRIWDGDIYCEHDWKAVSPRRIRTLDDVVNIESAQVANVGANCELLPTRGCYKCGAWEGELGQEPTPEMFIYHLVNVFDQVKRVLRDDGTCWINIADTYWKEDKIKHPYLKTKDLCMIPHRLAIELQKRGWYVRQEIVWHKPNPMPESVIDRCTNTHEYILLCSKRKNYYFDNIAISELAECSADKRAGKGRIHYGGKRNGEVGTGQSSFVSISEMRNKRSVWFMTTSTYKGAHFATFPEELPKLCILAGTSEKGCCSECGTPWKRIIDHPGNPEGILGYKGVPNAKTKAGGFDPSEIATTDGQRLKKGHNPTQFYKGKIIGWGASCKCDGKVVPCITLDIFNGSGTTGVVAVRNGRRYIGCEMKPEYIQLTHERMNGGKETLFDENC